MTRIVDSLLTLIYPSACGACGESIESHQLGAACHACWKSTRIFTGSETLCGKCGAFLGDGNGQTARCGRCADHDYDAACALGIYELALAASVLQLKHSARLSPFLKHLIISRLQNSLISVDVVLPVPLSARRRIERGFNQAETIGEYAARVVRAEYKADSLRRKLHADRNRAMMDRKARELSVRNAFEVIKPDDFRGKTVLIVDDVLTSGATVSACAKVLKKNGATSVTVFTLARAV